jgi:pyruvate/2-oxoglutarate dehydrogenase complex dihydrolipoamide acyltransferase (E2) component
MEIDITEPLKKMAEIKEHKNFNVSFSAWLAKCAGQIVMENKVLNTFKRRRKLIVFDDVDISIVIEIATDKKEKIPYTYVVRNVETKSVKSITEEIRNFQEKVVDEEEQLKRDGTTPYAKLYALLPKFLRRFIIRKMLTNPFYLRKLAGTVGITSMGDAMKGQSGWLVPFRDKTLNLAIGGIKESNEVINGKEVKKKLLCTTFIVDHDIIDGAQGVRLIGKYSKLLGETTYLDDLEKI